MDVLEENKNELEKLAETFEIDGYKATADLIRKLKSSIPGKPDEMNKIYGDIVRTFKKEYAIDTFKKELFEHIENAVVSCIQNLKEKFAPKLLELKPLFEDMRKTAKNIEVVSKVFMKTNDIMERYFGTCFIYLLQIEGEFDSIVRLLYVLKMAERGVDVSLDDVYKMSLHCLHKKLKDLGMPGMLFKGWNNHIRNAIAHAHFTFDKETKCMIFVDINPTTGEEIYKETLPLNKFNEYVSAIDEVCNIFQLLLLLLRVFDLMINSWQKKN